MSQFFFKKFILYWSLNFNADEHLGCFQILVVMNITGKNSSVQGLLHKGKSCSVILGYIPKKIAGS